jgi:N-methylhydantoinase A
VSSAGILQVGPESAGAEPGPICYGRGGEEPTTTDANLLLGRLNPAGLLGVEGAAQLAAVRDRLDKKIGAHLGLGPEEVAAAIVRVANDKMAGAIRLVSLQRGYDPRDFILFAFGGAGPLHAAALARELAIPRVLVPTRPGITSALGCLVADVRHDFVKTINQDLLRMDVGAARTVFADQIARGRTLLAAEGVEIETVTVQHEADMQFAGQTHVLTVPIARTDFEREELSAAFEKAYWERFEVELRAMPCLVMSLRTAVIGHRRPVSLERLSGASSGAGNLGDAQAGTRDVWFEVGWRPTPIYRRERLPAGGEFVGPAVVEQLDSTTVVEPDDHVRVDPLGNLVITVRGVA